MHSFDYGENIHKKRDNWILLTQFFKRRGLPIIIKDMDSLILNENNSTIEFVKQVYTLLTERALMPPIKVYDTENQDQQSLLLKDREIVKLPDNELDIAGDQEQEESKQEQSIMKESTSKSPQKSLAITKGPQRTIPQTLELDSYKAVEVKEIQIKAINQSVAQIRAHKELSSLHSQHHKMQSSEIHSQMNASQNGSQNVLGIGGDGASRILSAETVKEERQVRRKIADVLQEIIIKKQEKEASDDFALYRVENDNVTAFFDNIHKFSDEFTQSFVEDMESDMENIIHTIYNHVNELSVFYTYITMLLRRLSHQSNSFFSVLQFAKLMARKIVEDTDSPRDEFLEFFVNHLFRGYLQVAKEDCNKRAFICELIYAHT